MKHAFGKQIAIGLMASMIAAGPVFAETTPTVSESISRKKKPAATTQTQEPVQTQNTGAAGPAVSGMNRLNLPPMQRPAPAQDLNAQEEGQENLAPYLEKTLTKISIEGNQEIPTEDILKATYSKPGLPLTEEEIFDTSFYEKAVSEE